jgi:hypothetical protein
MDAPCQFMVFNCSFTCAVLLSRITVLPSPVVEVKNVTVPAGERFYDAPVSEVVIVNMLV